MVISESMLAAVVAAPPALALAVSDSTWTAFFVSLPATIAATATVIVALRNAKQIQKIEVATNSMKDALVAKTEQEALARGVLQGKVAEKEKQADIILAVKTVVPDEPQPVVIVGPEPVKVKVIKDKPV